MILIIFVAFGLLVYLMMIRPQQRQVRQHQALVDALEVGDDVVTSSGLYGTITAVDEETIDVEIADGVEVTMSRRAVMEVAVDGDDGDDEDDKNQTADEQATSGDTSAESGEADADADADH